MKCHLQVILQKDQALTIGLSPEEVTVKNDLGGILMVMVFLELVYLVA